MILNGTKEYWTKSKKIKKLFQALSWVFLGKLTFDLIDKINNLVRLQK